MLNRGMRLVAAAGIVAAAVPATARAASRIGWVHADGYAEQHRHPARFYPGHLVDGDRRTTTCFAAGPQGQAQHTITIGLRGTAHFTAVRVDNGDQRRKHAPKSHHRVRELILESAHATQTLTLPDTGQRQEVKLGSPIVGDQVTVVIKSAYGHGGLVCLSGLTFMQRRYPAVARGMRYHRHRARLEGLWAAGPKGAPEQFLAFFYDGQYRWTFSPNDPDAHHRTFMGRYTVRGHTLRLQVPGHWVRLRFHLKHAAGGAGKAHRRLELEGSRRLPKHLAGAYRDHWL